MTRIGVVTALPQEARVLAGKSSLCRPPGVVAELGTGTLLVQCGVGAQRAASAAAELIARGARALASVGIAGGLAPECRAGDVLLPEVVQRAAAPDLTVDAAWRDRAAVRLRSIGGAHAGPLAHSDEVVASPAAKAALRVRGALAVDMESAAVVGVAAAAGLPALVLRCVADPPSLAIPRTALRAVRIDGSVDFARALAALARRPQEIVALLRLAHASARALRRLRRAVLSLGPDLAFAAPP
ncbi:MAG: purine phosphorylase [Planctomycetes bacterium]|nr:purine phosphorylase [Planctomycetota bacterium]